MIAGGRGVDWPRLMRAGLADMGLAPELFWSLTPAELMLIAGADAQGPLRRAGLDALIARFPDGKDDHHAGS